MRTAVEEQLDSSALPRLIGWRQRIASDRLVSNAFYLMLSTATQGGLGFVFWVLSARLFETHDVGLATSLISATSVIAYLGLLGFNHTFVRYLPTSADRNTEINNGLILVFVSTALISAVYVVVIPSIAPKLAFVTHRPLYAVSFVLLSAFVAINLATDSIFVAYRSAFYNFAVDGLIMGMAKILLAFTLVALGGFGIFAAFGLASCLGTACSLILIRRRFGYQPRLRIHLPAVRKVLTFSAANYIASVLNLMPVLVVPLIVINRSSAVSAGHYYIAFQIGVLLFAVGYAISQSLFAEGAYEEEALKTLVLRVTKLAAAFLVPVSIAVATLSEYLLAIFGRDYRESAAVTLSWFALAAPFSFFGAIASAMLRIRKQASALIVMDFVYASTVIGLAFLWIERGISWVGFAWLIGNAAAGAVGAAFLLGRRNVERSQESVLHENEPDNRQGGPPPRVRTARPDETSPVNPPPCRVVAIVTPYFPPKIGGVESYAGQLARTLAATPDLRPVVITTNHSGRRPLFDEFHGVPVVRLGPWLKISNTPVNPRWVGQIRRLLDAYGVELVNLHSPVPFVADVGILAAGSRPVVLTYHAGSMRKGRQPVDLLIGGYERHVLPRLFERAQAIVAVSPRFRETSLSRWPDKALVIPPGVDTDTFCPASRRADKDPAVILYVGRIERTSLWKGIDVLLDAFAYVRARVPTARLELVGDGDAVEMFRDRAATLGIGDATRFLGVTRGDDLVAAYRGASVVVLPSTTDAESGATVLVEGMACGTPVVASRVGGIPYVVTDGVDGLLVAPGDVKALATSCLALLHDDNCAQRLGRAGREKALRQYQWSVQGDRYAALFRSLLVDSPTPVGGR